MLARVEAASSRQATLPRTRHVGDRVGDGLLYGLTALASILGVLVVFAIIWRVADGAWPAIKLFKLGFLWDNQWNVNLNQFGARDLIIGTVVTSFGAMILAAPLSIAIGLFLSELAPPAVRGSRRDVDRHARSRPVGRDRLWGIYVLAPFNASHVAPAIHSVLGWIPIFGGDPHTESTVFTAIVVLTIMTIPITSSICRELSSVSRPSSRKGRSGSARPGGRW